MDIIAKNNFDYDYQIIENLRSRFALFNSNPIKFNFHSPNLELQFYDTKSKAYIKFAVEPTYILVLLMEKGDKLRNASKYKLTLKNIGKAEEEEEKIGNEIILVNNLRGG